MAVDAHQHFWSLGRCRYDWLDASAGVLFADHGPKDLAPHLAEFGIDATVLVQASDTVDETRWLLELAAATDFVRGVVGWVPLDAPDAGQILRELARDPWLVGVRPMLQGLDDARWILRDAVAPGLDAVEELGLVFDALVRPAQLASVVELAHRRPDLALVLDHAGKPDVAAGWGWSGRAAWESALDELARAPRTAVKLSGLVNEAGPDWTVADLHPWVQAVLSRFGPKRVLWGSDWPVCRTAGGYARWRAASDELLSDLDADERAAVLGGTAECLYALAGDAPPLR
ncbi:Amidohydrolase [Planctomycetes bacterium Pla163]|uniref:Amidohydrolase n=1 Tax=Rohdeia mirabilis TaxID=2528008 RepID=A0A518D402_9BACT|nr:Amidohydrolase [Planctomycetes bacterium Pla163]